MEDWCTRMVRAAISFVFGGIVFLSATSVRASRHDGKSGSWNVRQGGGEQRTMMSLLRPDRSKLPEASRAHLALATLFKCNDCMYGAILPSIQSHTRLLESHNQCELRPTYEPSFKPPRLGTPVEYSCFPEIHRVISTGRVASRRNHGGLH